MKKKFLLITIIMLISQIIFAAIFSVDLNFASVPELKNNKGMITLILAKDVRNHANYDPKDKIEKSEFVGNTRGNYGIPNPIISTRYIEYVFTDMVYECLVGAGFNVIYKEQKTSVETPVVEIDITKFNCDGYMVYGVWGEIKIKMSTPSGKPVFEKTIAASTGSMMYADYIMEDAYTRILNKMTKQIYVTFISDFFLESYKGRQHLVIENTGDYTKKELDKIPSDIDPKVEYLNLDRNNIKTIENLSNLKSLISLNLTLNKIGKISNIDNLTSLESLQLSNNEIEKIDNISKLTKLTELDLNNNLLSKIENVDNFKNLEWLILSYNDIKKIENIDNLTKLLWLNLSYNKISKIENLDNQTNLIWLSLNGNKIKKIENLSNLRSLVYLDLSNNQISKIESMDKLVNLSSLNLAYNTGLSKIENIGDLVNLRKLNLSRTKVKKLENIETLVNLEELNISRTNIAKLENIENLINLKNLDISFTMINKLENLEKLSNLRGISLHEDQIKKITETTYNAIKDKVKFRNMKFEEFVKKYNIKVEKAK